MSGASALPSQKLAQIDQRERERQEQHQLLQSEEATAMASSTKTDEIVLLEKQGRCSQKHRRSSGGLSSISNNIGGSGGAGGVGGNLYQVSQNVGQNMTDISNIGTVVCSTAHKMPKILNSFTHNLTNIGQHSGLLEPPPPATGPRGSSLPPRNLAPRKKLDYDRLSDSDKKKTKRAIDQKSSQLQQPDKLYATLKRNDELQGIADLSFAKFSQGYGTLTGSSGNGGKLMQFGSAAPKNYQRLNESPVRGSKRSLLPKLATPPLLSITGSSSNNNSDNGRSIKNPATIASTNSRISPHHQMGGYHQLPNFHTKTPPPPPPKYVPMSSRVPTHKSASVGPSIYIQQPSGSSSGGGGNGNGSAAGGPSNLPPPKSSIHQRRGSSITRSGGENRYRIQI